MIPLSRSKGLNTLFEAKSSENFLTVCLGELPTAVKAAKLFYGPNQFKKWLAIDYREDFGAYGDGCSDAILIDFESHAISIRLFLQLLLLQLDHSFYI